MRKEETAAGSAKGGSGLASASSPEGDDPDDTVDIPFREILTLNGRFSGYVSGTMRVVWPTVGGAKTKAAAAKAAAAEEGRRGSRCAVS